MKWSKYILLMIGISFYVIGCSSKENVRDEIIAKVKGSFPILSDSVHGKQDNIDDNTIYHIVIQVEESFIISGWIIDSVLYESTPIRYDFMNDVIYYNSPENNFTCRVTYSNREIIHER